MTDAELLVAHLRGSRSAFAGVIRRHVDLVYAAALRRTHDPATAEDVTQAVFVLLARKADALRHRPTVAGWLLAATRHVALTHRRAALRRTRHERAAARPEAVVDVDDAIDLGPMLDDALATLRPGDRDAITLRYFKRLSLADVGRTLGVGEEATRKRVDRAIGRLRGTLLGRGVRVSAELLAATAAAYGQTPAPAKTVAATIAAVPLGPPGAPGRSGPNIVKGALRMLAWKKIIIGAAVAMVAVSGVAVAVREMDQTAASPSPARRAASQPASQPATRPAMPLMQGEAYIGGLTGRPGAYSVHTNSGEGGRQQRPTLRRLLHDAYAPDDRRLEIDWFHGGHRGTVDLFWLDRLGGWPAGGPAVLDELVQPNDQIVVRPSGIGLAGWAGVAGPLDVPRDGFLALRDAVERARPRRDVLPSRPLRAYILVSPPPEPGVVLTSPWPGKVKWVADLDGPIRDTDGSHVRAGDTLAIWQCDATRDAVRRSAAYLHEIGQALLKVRAETSDLPLDIEDLMTRAPGLAVEHFFSPRLTPGFGRDISPEFGQCDRGPLLKWVGREADYVYTPPAWNAPLPADWVLVREPTDIGLGEVLVLRGDGRVELLATAETVVRLAKQTPTTRPAAANG